MRVLVFGAGAVGQWMGALLAQGGAVTTLLVRPRLVEALRLGGIRLGPAERSIPVRVVASLDELDGERRACDWLILAVKTFDVEAALVELLAAGLEPGRVLCIQNGVGTEEVVAQAFGAERTYVGSVTRAVGVDGPGQLRPATRGGLAVAPFLPDLPPEDLEALLELLDLLGAQGVPTVIEPDAQALKWSKLLLNMVANASSAILDMPPSRVLESRALYSMEIRALREALRVMARKGLSVLDLPGYPVRWLSRAARALPTALSFPVLGPRMAAGRGEKSPSLLLDLRSGRARTEVGWINGAVAAAAAELAVPAPTNRALARILEALASGQLPASAFRRNPEALLEALAREAGGTGKGAVESPPP